MKILGIYKITSPSGKIYIGSSIDINSRWNQYERLECKNQTKVHNSLVKHGFENHNFEILEECEFEKLYSLERAWGNFYNVLDVKVGLNLSLPGYGDIKGLVSEETRLKQSISAKNVSQEIKDKRAIAKIGTQHSEETKLKMSISHKNISEETRLKMSLGQTGRKHSAESIEKVKLAHKGRKLSEESKLKVSIGNKGKKRTEEQKLAQSIRQTGTTISEETRLRLFEAWKVRKLKVELEKINIEKELISPR